MSTVEKIIQTVKQSTAFNENRKILQEKATIDLHITFDGSIFLCSAELISLLSSFETDYLIVVDVYDNPVKVERKKLLALVKENYVNVTSEWHSNYETIARLRKV